MHVPSLSPPSWNNLLPPFRTGPQLTIFGTSTKVSLIHSTNTRGTLKSAGTHSFSHGGPQKSPGPPSKESWVLGNELPGMRGSESSGEPGCCVWEGKPVFLLLFLLVPVSQPLRSLGHSSPLSICSAAYYQSLSGESGTRAQRGQSPSLGHTAELSHGLSVPQFPQL